MNNRNAFHSISPHQISLASVVSHNNDVRNIPKWKSLLRLLHIVDRKTGKCIYQYQWKWDTNGTTQGVESLVQSFLQLARQLDNGTLSCCHFENLKPSCSVTGPHGRRASLSKRSRFQSGYSPMHVQESVKMICVTQPLLLGVLFYDQVNFAGVHMDPLSEQYLKDCTCSFAEQFQHDIGQAFDAKSFDEAVIMLQSKVAALDMHQTCA